MPSSFTQNFYHTVFSTKHRANWITPVLEQDLYPFMGGILRDLRCTLLAINGMPDHIHLLIRYRADLSHSDMLRHLKSRSSKWIHETFADRRAFAWQAGYGAFAVSYSHLDGVKKYLADQEEHHRVRTFQEEFREFLKRHQIEYDER